ncbi:YppG family protein [Ectobacillus sp. sgz5001026]|uniref:YppG family protein n=1 Tax=Ectobacillus sp. sgz5001026 TaxID=3242473 RepID=UPI0036D226D7
MYPNQNSNGYMYNMYPFEPVQTNQPNYYEPFQLSFLNQQPSFYPPPQPSYHPTQPPYQHAMNPYNPYPTKNSKTQQQGQFSNIISQFKTNDGNYDINKMMNTAGQMMNAMNQVTGLVKQVGGFFIK